jgi:hypothetical protein
MPQVSKKARAAAAAAREAAAVVAYVFCPHAGR